MDAQLLDSLLSNATLIASIITALAAIVAPIITTLITQRGSYKTKSAEMFFQQKVTAYSNFLTIASEYSEPLSKPSKEKTQKLQAASTRAILFASPDTQEKIGRYGQLLTENSFSPADIQALALAHTAMILAMQKELKKYE